VGRDLELTETYALTGITVCQWVLRWSSLCDILYFCGICGEDGGGAALFYSALFYCVEQSIPEQKRKKERIWKTGWSTI